LDENVDGVAHVVVLGRGPKVGDQTGEGLVAVDVGHVEADTVLARLSLPTLLVLLLFLLLKRLLQDDPQRQSDPPVHLVKLTEGVAKHVPSLKPATELTKLKHELSDFRQGLEYQLMRKLFGLF
jgi:hypothetical protein